MIKMVNLSLETLSKSIINLIGEKRIKSFADQGVEILCSFLETQGFPKQVCKPIAEEIKKLIRI